MAALIEPSERTAFRQERVSLAGAAMFHVLTTAVRSLRARRTVAVLAIVLVAIGIGASTAVFSAVNALLFRPLPLRDPERLVTGFALREGFDPFGTSLLEFDAYRARTDLFETTGLSRANEVTVQLARLPEHVRAAAITADYLPTLGVSPIKGRTLRSEDERPGRPRVVIVSESLWERRLAAGEGVIGSSIIVDGAPATVVGILPRTFDLPAGTDLWLPLQLTADALPLGTRLQGAYTFVARLRPGVALNQADRELKSVARLLEQQVPQRRGWTYRLIGLRQSLIGDLEGRVRRSLMALMGAVGLLLAICCANVANLLLAVGVTREREVAVRFALGASAGQVLRELLAEHLLLGVAGGAGGCLLATWLAPWLASLNPIRAAAFSGLLMTFSVDRTALVFAFIASAISVLCFGVVPALVASRGAAPASMLQAGSVRTGLSRPQRRRLSALVVAEIAVAVTLLIAGGLVYRTFSALRNADLGFHAEQRLTTQITLPMTRYGSHERRATFVRQLLERVGSIPGVMAAGVTSNVPLQLVSIDSLYTVEGRVPGPAHETPITAHRVVSPQYLETIGVTLTRGRLLTWTDGPLAPRVVVVTEEFARQAWPGIDPVGRRVRRGRAEDTQHPWLTVVGVVRDVKEDRFNFRINRPAWYLPFDQQDITAPINLVVRTSAETHAVSPALREHVGRLDPDLGVSEVLPLPSLVAEVLVTERFAAVLLSTLAGAGLLLAALGLGGVIAYSVRRRAPELAIRLALGARPADVVWMIMSGATLLTTTGVALGMSASLGVSRVLAGILYEVTPTDAITFVATAACVIAVGVLAAYVPARRVMSCNIARTLRD